MKKGRPRFFCEHCGAEVSLNAEHCPSCGRSFASVLCPKCGFTGAESLFKNGCPGCGYSAHAGDIPVFSPPEYREAFQKGGPLPLWVYIVTIAAFIVTAGIFLFHLMR